MKMTALALTRAKSFTGIAYRRFLIGVGVLCGAFCTSCFGSPKPEQEREPPRVQRCEGEVYGPKSPSFRVAVFTPHENTFWNSFTKIMAQATVDLGGALEVFQAHDSRERMRQQVLSVVGRKAPPDYIVFQNFKGLGPELAKISENGEMPFFVVNAAMDTKALGAPRQRNRYWLGQMSPDDVSAGETVARALVDAAKSKKMINGEGLVEMVAISGVRADVAGRDREDGLGRMLAKSRDVKFHQLVNGDWTGEVAGQRLEDLLKRYPTTKVVWTANESIAMATIARLKELGLRPGKDILVGSVDWASREILLTIRRGEMDAAVGGHFTEGAWVAVLLADHHRGLDFSDLFVELRTEMVLATPKNVGKYLDMARPDFVNRIDFKRMMRPCDSEGYRYPFNPNTLFQLAGEARKNVADEREGGS